MKILLYTALFLALTTTIYAQDYSVRGKVVDSIDNPLSFVNIILMKSSDSSFVKGSITNDQGNFIINSLPVDRYLVKFSYIGYNDLLIPLILNENKNLKTVVLEEDVTSLDEVSIFYKKPTVIKAADRLTFNVANTALIEGDMLQVLRSTPGVLVQDSGISVKGQTPAVYINNRKVQLTSSEITQLLGSSSANSIQSIEVITNPSARYDADSGVVIRIVMGKNLITGYHGTVSSDYTQGVFPRYDVGTNHFFKNEKLSFNLNYNFSRDKLARKGVDIVDYFDNNNSIDETWRSATDRNTEADTHNASFNFDYFIDDNNTLSFNSSALWVPNYDYYIDNKTDITDTNGDFLSNFNSFNNSKDDTRNLAFDLSFRHLFAKGSLSFNAHYTNYDYNRLQRIDSKYLNFNGSLTDQNSFRTDANQGTEIFTSKIDYVLPLSDDSNFEAGIKYSGVLTESDIRQFNIDHDTGNEQFDPNNTDAFDYDEKVFAAYANYNFANENWNITAGLRAEQTNIEGNSLSTNQINTQDYLEWFPSGSLQYNFSDGFYLAGTYRRTISRPKYVDLNPFRVYINENFISVGNPSLKPVFSNFYKGELNLFGNLNLAAYYKQLYGDIYEIPFQDNENMTITYSSVNFDDTVEYGFDAIYYFNAAEWWFVTAITSFYNGEETTDFGLGSVRQDQWSNYSELSNDFTLLKDGSLNANFSLQFVGKNQFGLRTVEDRLFSTLSVSKTIMNKKAVISLEAGDLFNMQDQNSQFRYLNQSSSVYTNLDNRYIKLGFRYNFGNTILQSNQRAISQEERERISKKL